MSTRQPSDDPDVDVNALHREVGADSVAGTPTRRMLTRQHRRETEAAALHGPNTQSGTAPARVQNPYFYQLVSGRDFDDEYDESEYASGLASVWQPTSAHHVNAQQASNSNHVNAKSAANPSMIEADKLARAFAQYASMSSGVSRIVPEKKALAVAVVIYMHTMHAWLNVQMLWQMHGRTLQAVHMLIVCMGIFADMLK